MVKFAVRTAAFLGFAAVGIGAFGAHTFKQLLVSNGKFDTFETAVRYHFYGSFVILSLGLLYNSIPSQSLKKAIYLYLIGTFIFCLSLYIISFGGPTILGAVAPAGGLCLLAGWFFVALSTFKN